MLASSGDMTGGALVLAVVVGTSARVAFRWFIYRSPVAHSVNARDARKREEKAAAKAAQTSPTTPYHAKSSPYSADVLTEEQRRAALKAEYRAAKAPTA